MRLRHPNTGMWCAVLAAAACALGSALSKWAPNFNYRHVGQFWFAPRWQAVWVSGLVAVSLFWLLHSLFQLGGLWPKSSRKSDHHQRVTIALFQLTAVALLIAYVAMVVAKPPEIFRVTQESTEIHGERYRALRVEAVDAQRRIARPTAAWLERRVGTRVTEMRVERARWWSSSDGRYRLALARAMLRDEGAIFRHGNRQVTLQTGTPVREGSQIFRLRSLFHRFSSRHGYRERARVDPTTAPRTQEVDSTISDRDVHAALEIGGKTTTMPVDPEWAGQSAFLGMKQTPRLILRVYRDMTVTLAFASVALLVVALALAGLRRRLSTRTL